MSAEVERFRAALKQCLDAAQDMNELSENANDALTFCIMIAARVEILGEDGTLAQIDERLRMVHPHEEGS